MNGEFKSVPDSLIARHAGLITDRGHDYATALLSLVPELGAISANDRAVGFDVGSGTDLVAFQKLGFKHIEWLNEPELLYVEKLNAYYLKDEQTREAIIKKLPSDCIHSNLDLRNWLESPKYSPKLVTMLAMAPQYLRDGRDPAKFLRNFASFATHLSQTCTIVLSARDDHIHGERAFTLAHDFFQKNGVQSQLFIKDKDVLNDWRMLGDFVLVLNGVAH